MARIEDEVDKIADPRLRKTILDEIKKLKAAKHFGLVFEEHLPELVPLYRAPIKARSIVARRGKTLNETYLVVRVNDGMAEVERDGGNRDTIPVEELTVVCRFGVPIYPALERLDSVHNGDESQPHHILIEADNFHALQLLEYCYSSKVDCIYIDPPYNTGARDWKYNNDYVDSNDTWRHSKWLSMMKKRLLLAKRLLKPDTGVLICTIDEHEVHHLGCLLEDLFRDTVRQMITITVNPKGVTQGRFSRVEEHAIYCFGKGAFVRSAYDDLLSIRKSQKFTKRPRWAGLLRSGTGARREDRSEMFFPILIDETRKAVVGTGLPLPRGEEPDLDAQIGGYSAVWPIRSDGSYGRWGVGYKTLRALISKGYVAVGGYDSKRKTWAISYLNQKIRKQIDSGQITIVSYDKRRNLVLVEYAEARDFEIKTLWHRSNHDAGAYGSDFLKDILGRGGTFSFPKSLYAVRDAIASVVRDRPDAVVLDFFAGSGTTMNAVNLLNASDKGHRQCVLVTNNEVSESEAKRLSEIGVNTGHDEWESNGICRSVTFPRNKYTILGKRDDGSELEGVYLTGRMLTKEKPRAFKQLGFTEGHLLTIAQRKQLVGLLDKIPQSKITAEMPFFIDDEIPASILFDIREADAWLEALEETEHISDFYLVTPDNRAFASINQQIQELLGPVLEEEEEKRPMKLGFSANLEFFKLNFLERTDVQMGRQFKAILPILWMMAGAKGTLPEAPDPRMPWLLPAECPFAVLMQETHFKDFHRQILEREDLTHIFIVTNSCETYHRLCEEMDAPNIIQLYKDYLDNFKINFGKD